MEHWWKAVYHCCHPQLCDMLQVPTENRDLPLDHLSTDPPFSYVGVDSLWTVTIRRSREGCTNSIQWAVIFSCMSTRAIHVEAMESSNLINALQRFLSIRGPIKQLRSDCGINFLGAYKELGIDSRHCNNEAMQSFLTNN